MEGTRDTVGQASTPSTSAPRFLSRRDFYRLGVDAIAWYVGLTFAALARFDFMTDEVAFLAIAGFAVAAILLQFVIGHFLHLYRGRYRYGSFDEVSGLSAAVISVGLILTAFDYFAFDERAVPASTPLVGSLVALILMFAARYVWRYLLERSLRPDATTATKVLIFGAGDGGTQVLLSMIRDPQSIYLPVGILDDDPMLQNRRVSGVHVMGTRNDIEAAAGKTGATTLIIAIARADAALLRDVNAIAAGAGLTVKVVPSVSEIIDGKITSADIRDINEADLLGRTQIETDLDAIAHTLLGKRVLVTGAGGSIGSELCRQIYRYDPAELIMLDRDESALHAVQLAIHGRAMLDDESTVLADIRDEARVQEVFTERRPEVVFHAAALKHLPLLEKYPAEAVKSNIWGTLTVLRAAQAIGVGTFVNISTDKAANPISVLGYSKRIAERLTAQVATETDGTYLSVRFGNVLGSRGSVLTAFESQIEVGGPVTVTDPDVTRYFMTVQEAVQLVIQAAAIGRDGEALVLDMGGPVRIADVARQLISQSPEPIEIVFTGLRPGEKLDEDLFSSDEVDNRPVHPLISHVAVPVLDPRLLGSLTVESPAHVLRQALGGAVDSPSPSPSAALPSG